MDTQPNFSDGAEQRRSGHRIHVLKRADFLHRCMVELAGLESRMSLEGDLSRCRFLDHLVVSREVIGEFRRNTLQPRQDFVVLQLRPDDVDTLFKEMLRAGLKHAIIHVEIQRGQSFELGAYDNFCEDCVSAGPQIRREVLEEMKAARIIKSYEGPY